VRIADRFQRQQRRVVLEMLLIVEVEIGVPPDAEIQRQPLRRPPVVLEPCHDLLCVKERVRQNWVGLLPLAHDAGRLQPLRIAAVAVGEDDRRIVEEGERREVFVAVQETDVIQIIEIGPHLQRMRSHLQRDVVLDLEQLRVGD